MSASYSHQDIQELLGAFALDAVDPDERDVIEAHLPGCPRCRAEVEGHRETAALLAHKGDRAPEGVWDRIAGALDEAPPALDLTRLGPRDDLAQRREAGQREGRSGPRSISLRVASATMAVAAAVVFFLGVAIGRNDSDLGRIDDALTAMEQIAVSNAAQAALKDPRAEQVKLASTDGAATAQVVRLPDGTGYLLPDNLAALPEGRVYQLWAVRSDAKISLGVIGRDPDVSGFRMTGPVLAYALTEEASGGVATSGNQPVVVGFVKA